MANQLLWPTSFDPAGAMATGHRLQTARGRNVLAERGLGLGERQFESELEREKFEFLGNIMAGVTDAPSYMAGRNFYLNRYGEDADEFPVDYERGKALVSIFREPTEAAKPISLPGTSRLVSATGETIVPARPPKPEKIKRGATAQEAYDMTLAELGSKDHPEFKQIYRGYMNRIFNSKQSQREKGLVSITVGKPAPSGERESLNKLFEFRQRLERIEQLFDPDFVGRVQGGVVGAAREFFGIAIEKKEAMFRQVVKDIADTLLRLRSGAQINEQEYRRLTKLVPTVDLPDNVFLARLESLTKSIDDSIEIRQGTLKESGFRAPGTEIQINLEDMSDDELFQQLGE